MDNVDSATHATDPSAEEVVMADHDDVGNDQEDGTTGRQDEAGITEIEDESKDSVVLKTSNRYCEDDADTTIISSDGVTFKVHSYMLKSSSPTFRSMLNLAMNDSQRTPIILTSDNTEHSSVLETLFNIMYDLEVASFKDCHLIAWVIDLAEKWDFSSVLSIIRQQMRVHLTEQKRGHQSLLIAAIKLKDYPFVAHIIEAGWNRKRGVQTEEPETKAPQWYPFVHFDTFRKPFAPSAASLAGEKLFVPGAMSLCAYCRLPPSVAWALSRAQYLAEQEAGKAFHPAHIGKHLKILLDELYPSEQTVGKRKAQGDQGGSE